MLTIPQYLWEEMLNLLATAPAGVEQVAYLDGVLVTTKSGARVGVATTVTVPDALLTPGYYRVTGENVTAASVHLFGHDLRRLAQVHTHGDAHTLHSPTDDDMAYSKAPGAISIVLPYHARTRPAPTDGTVHSRQDGSWIPLDHKAAREAIRLVPSVVDLRPRPIGARVRTSRGWWCSSRTWLARIRRFRRHA